MKESTGREDITIRAKREKRQMEEEVNEPAVGKRSNPTAELIDLFFGSFPSFPVFVDSKEYVHGKDQGSGLRPTLSLSSINTYLKGWEGR